MEKGRFYLIACLRQPGLRRTESVVEWADPSGRLLPSRRVLHEAFREASCPISLPLRLSPTSPSLSIPAIASATTAACGAVAVVRLTPGVG